MQHNYQERICKLYDEYYECHETEGATAKEVAAWAIANGKFELDVEDTLKVAAKKFSEAFRQEMIVDPQGRTVRRKHAAIISTVTEDGKEQKRFEWSNLEVMRYERVVLAASHRRSGIRGDVDAYRDDFGSYNDNHLPKGKPPINMSFNFDADEDEQIA